MKYTDKSRTVIDMGDGSFVPVDPMNRDYREIIAPRLTAGEAVAPPDQPPPVPASVDQKVAELAAKVAALEAKAEVVK